MTLYNINKNFTIFENNLKIDWSQTTLIYREPSQKAGGVAAYNLAI